MIQISILFFSFAAPELWIKRNSWAQVDNPWIIHHPVLSSRCRDPCADSCAFEPPGGLGYNWETGFSYAKSYFISQTCASSSLRLQANSLMNSLTSSFHLLCPSCLHTITPCFTTPTKRNKNIEKCFTFTPRNLTPFSQMCVASGLTVWMHIWLHRGELPHSALHQTGQKKPNLLFHFTRGACFALKEWQNNTDKVFLQSLSCLM